MPSAILTWVLHTSTYTESGCLPCFQDENVKRFIRKERGRATGVSHLGKDDGAN